jgi:glycosyltransferase involved in cell wall biosynthesis
MTISFSCQKEKLIEKDYFLENIALELSIQSDDIKYSVKNIDLAIRVIKELHNQDNNIKLLIYGDGDQKELMHNYIKKLNCSEYIKLMGSENNKEKIYNSIDALISFSSIEGLPTVILESINFNKPIFYTDCSSGPRELMSPNSNPLEKTKNFEKTDVGYLVKPIQKIRAYELELDKYEEEYVDILKFFVDDVKNNKFSMKYDEERFSEEIIINEWKKIIMEIRWN